MQGREPGRTVYEASYDEQVDGSIGLPSCGWDDLPARDKAGWARIEAVHALSVAGEPEAVSGQARRYMEAVYGKDVWFRAPETFANMTERWIWAVASASRETAEKSIAAIEEHFRKSGERPG